MIQQLEAEVAIERSDKLGEGPVWDQSEARLLWGDHGAHLIREAKSDGAGGWRETRRWDLRRPLAAFVPRSRGGLIVVGGRDVSTFDADAPTVEKGLQPFVSIQAHSELLRMNDAKCDAYGRLWASSLCSDFKVGAAGLYRIDPDGQISQMLAGVTLGNGLDWSPDSSEFYFVESYTREVLAFDFDLARGTISSRRTLTTFTHGVPNGMAVDLDGNVWIAATGGGNVQCYSPRGERIATVSVATPGATSCCFGGPDGASLFITTRSGRMPEAARQMGVDPAMMEDNSAAAGAVYVCKPGAKGAPANAFAG